VWGGKVPPFLLSNGASKTKKKNYILALDRCRLKYHHTTTNQKHASALNDGMKEWFEWSGTQGGVLCIVSAAIKRQYIQKNIIIR
jgi:hypothetical protein